MKHSNARSLVLSGVTIGAIAVVTHLILRLLPEIGSPVGLIMPLIPYLTATALGGYLALHIFKIRWHELVNLVAVMSAAIAAYAAISSEGIALGDQLKLFLVYLVATSGGVFLLPLFDSQIGISKRPKFLKYIALTILINTTLLLVVDLSVGRSLGSPAGLLMFILGLLLGAIAIGLGLFFNLLRDSARAAWVGSIGVSLCFVSYIAWVFFGAPWFP